MKVSTILFTASIFIIFLFSCSEENIVTPTEDTQEILIHIDSPASLAILSKSQEIHFSLTALDASLDTLLYDSLKWESNLDGWLAQHTPTEKFLSAGLHTITATVYKDEYVGFAEISLNITDTLSSITYLNSSLWKVLSLSNHQIYHIAFDQQNNPLLATYDGGLFYKEANLWKSYTTFDGLMDNALQFVSVDNDNMIYTCNGLRSGIDKFNGTSWVTIAMDDSLGGDVHSIIFDFYNILWAATHNGKLIYFDYGIWNIIPNQPKMFVHPYDLIIDQNGAIWGSSEWGGAFKYDGSNWQLLTIDGEEVRLEHLVLDNSGNAWAMWSNKLYRFGINDSQLNAHEYIIPPNLPVQSTVMDHNNIIWMGSSNNLMKFNGTDFEIIPLPNISEENSSIINLAVDTQNNIWFTKGNKLYTYKGDRQ